jgi:hypothetical protein
MKLIGRRVERGAAECVVGRRIDPVLLYAASAERTPAAPATVTTRGTASAASATAAGPTGSARATATRKSSGSAAVTARLAKATKRHEAFEARRQLKVAARQRVVAIVQQAVVDARRRTGEGDGIAGRIGTESGRQEQRVLRNGVRFDGGLWRGFLLDIESLKPLRGTAGTSSSGRPSAVG